MKRVSEIDRFLSHVRKTSGCWYWTACRLPRGYGQFRLPDGHELAHRASYRLFVGPFREKQVLHVCDVPACVNPAHLWLGSQTDNMRDAKRKGRTARGEAHGRHKLTNAEVAVIRASHLYQRELAAAFGVTQSHISEIRSGNRWADGA
jgi:predicted XRE-type DNA-binding protein